MILDLQSSYSSKFWNSNFKSKCKLYLHVEVKVEMKVEMNVELFDKNESQIAKRLFAQVIICHNFTEFSRFSQPLYRDLN
jgi:hypothetical protein